MYQRCWILATVVWGILHFQCTQLRGTEKSAPLVIGETFTIESKILNEKRKINVYLPAGYSESTDVRLPVLYMPDGGMAEDFLHVAGLLQVLIGNETIRPFLLVGIENTERRRDLTGPTENVDDRKIAPRVGGSKSFRDFLRNELMPQVTRRYRTTKETAIVGESLAGLFVLETFLHEPDLFDIYIAIDPSLWWNDHRMMIDASKKLSDHPAKKKTLYLACSSEEKTPGLFRQLVDVLKKHAPKGLRWYQEVFPDEKHSTIYHPAALKAFREVLKSIEKPQEK